MKCRHRDSTRREDRDACCTLCGNDYADVVMMRFLGEPTAVSITEAGQMGGFPSLRDLNDQARMLVKELTALGLPPPIARP